MNKRFVGLISAVTVIAVLVVAGAATAEKPVRVVSGNIETIFNGGFSPKTLSKNKLTPISFWISGELKSLNEEQLPAMTEFILEGDKNASISVKGIPVCNPGKLQSTTSARARAACGKTLIGSGKAKADIDFAEQPTIPVTSELLAFNGGFKGGVTTIYLHAYITVPTPAAIITPVKVTRVKNGRFGLKSVARIPKIAGGNGSVTFFKLQLKKGILSAKCPDGRLHARGSALFKTTPPTSLKGAVVRPCTGKG